ncbi:hypothetical protein D3C86_1690710 [compost metagenome]
MYNVLVYLTQSCADRGQFRSTHSLRYLVDSFFKALIDQLAGKINVYIFFENDGNHRESETGNTPRFFNSGYRRDALLYGECYQLLYLLPCQCGTGGEDLHLVIGNIRYRINWQFRGTPQTPDDEQ